MRASDENAVFSRALKILARCSQPEKGLRDKLERQFPASPWVEKTVDKLKAMGYLNDFEYARAFARRALIERALGAHRVMMELTRRGISPETARAAFTAASAEAPEAAALERSIRKWQRAHGKAQTRPDRLRLAAHLARQGFEFEAIRSALATADLDEFEGKDD